MTEEGLWELLNRALDIEKTTFITRVSTYGSLKKCQEKLEVPAEVLSGLFNFQTGAVLEPMHLRDISREQFKADYLDRQVEGFEFEPSYNPWIWFVNISKDGEVESVLGRLKE